MPGQMPRSVTVLGAGITSLSFAHRLTTLSPSTRVTIVEGSDRVGGWLQTTTMRADDGREVAIEEGPRSVRPKGGIGAVRMLQMVKDVGLESSLVTVPTTHPSAQNRFLLWPSTTLQKLPSGLLSLLTSSYPITLPMLGAIMRELFRRPSPSPSGDESVDSLVRRRFGPHVADNMLSAMVHGIYAADSRMLSVRSAFPFLWEAEQRRGSVVRALFRGLGKKTAKEVELVEREERAWKELGELGQRMRKGVSVWGLKGGLATLSTRLRHVLEHERGVEFRMQERAQALDIRENGTVQVTTDKEVLETDLVVSTLSSTHLAACLTTSSALPHLTANPSATVSVVTLVFPAPSSPSSRPYHPAGFGYLVPRSNVSNPSDILGVVFDSSAMGEADSLETSSSTVKLTVMIGGPHYNDASRSRSPDSEATLIATALAHVRTTLADLPKDLEPILAFAKTHKDCIPTYAPRHGSRMQELHRAIQGGPWSGKLAVAGASYGGVSLNDCAESGARLAELLVAGAGRTVTGLERWEDWDSSPASIATGVRTSETINPVSTRVYSTMASPYRSSHLHSRSLRRQPRLPLTRTFTSSPRHSAQPSSPPPPPTWSPIGRPATRSAPWLARQVWNGFLIYLVLTALYLAFVVLGNSSFFFSAILDAVRGDDIKAFQPPAGSKVTTLEDVKGCDEAKEELREFVEFLKNPEKFSSLGGRPHKGVLLSGPPGTGKTLLARAVAGEADVPFFYASGSDFEGKYVGVGAQKVRQLFKIAKAHAPAIIFIDELDSIGGKREDGAGGGLSSGQASIKQTLNMFLTELDGFSPSEDVIVMAATNFPESLDSALTRPGRFDRHVHVPLPDMEGRKAILEHYIANVVVAPEGVDLSVIARGTPGMTGADLESLVNQAAIRASKLGCTAVALEHLEWSKDRSLMGVERKSRYISPESLRTSAVIEAGRALVALKTPGAVPLHKVSILPRGTKLSITSQVPGLEKDSISYMEYLARIDVALAGRVAEELAFGEENLSDRTHEDLGRASYIADAMVKKLGFSDEVGLPSWSDREAAFLSKGRKDAMETEVRRLLSEARDRARAILTQNERGLGIVVAALLEYQTLSAKQIEAALKGEKITPMPAALPPPAGDVEGEATTGGRRSMEHKIL